MSQQSTESLLQQVQSALQTGDKKTATMLINQILADDFTNPHVWQFLHGMLGKDVPLETFKLQFAQKYYPSKVNFIIQAQTNDASIPATAPIPTKPRLTKKCPYCAEEILTDAILCRFCGQDLIKGLPQITNEKQKILNYALGDLEKKLIVEEMSLQKWEPIFQEEYKATNTASAWFIIGLVLTPVGVGFLIAFFAADQYIRRNRKRRQADEQLTLIRENVEQLRQKIAETKTELAILR